MQRDNLTQAIEDYLKIIYELAEAGRLASTSQIAEMLQVSPASVSEMLKKLAGAHPPLVVYHKHRGVALTFEGEQIALEILRHHRLIELYLHRVLGYGWDEVHAEADRLEHVISEAFEERIALALGDPQRDPHGDPIPSRELRLPEETDRRLSELRAGERAVIRRVRSSDGALLGYLEQHGLVPGARLEVLEVSPFDDNLLVQVEGQPQPQVLGPKISRLIWIDP